MNKNRNKVAAMMMVAAITVSSVAMPVEAAVSSVESVGIERGNGVAEKEDIYLDDIPDKKFRQVIRNEANDKGITISEDGKIKKEDIEKFKNFLFESSSGIDYEEEINLDGIEKFIGLESLKIYYLNLKNEFLDLSNNKSLETIILESANGLKETNLLGLESLEFLDINTNNMKSLDLSSNKNLKTLILSNITSNSKNALGYLKLNENVQLDSYSNLSTNTQHTSVLVDKKSGIKEINLEEEFPGIDINNIDLKENQGVTIEGNILKWKEFPTKPIKYQYKTQGKKDGVLLNVRLHIEDSYGITEGVVINETNFPDKEFRNYLCSSKFTEEDNNLAGGWHFNEGETISPEYLRKLKTVNINREYNELNKVKDLTGIKYFKNLTHLDCGGNKIENLDLSNNKNLKNLSCYENNLKKLDLSNNKDLMNINCRGNIISELILPENNTIEGLYCNQNRLTSLDETKLTKVKWLDCQDNFITRLELSGMKMINSLNCGGNKLTSLKIPKLDSLTRLNCGANELSKLDVSTLTNLEYLNCFKSKNLKNLVLSNKDTLTNLNCSETGLQEIDLKDYINLSNLDLSFNNMTSTEKLYLENKKNLVILNLSNNKITSNIELNASKKLTNIDLSNNEELKNVDLSENEALEELNISGTKIGKLKVHGFVPFINGIENRVFINANEKSIDLKKEFDITEEELKNNVKIVEPSSGIRKNGTTLEWDDDNIKQIHYRYNCGGRYGTTTLDVILMINSSEGENPDKPTNPDQGGGSGGGTTTPDQKPDQKPDEKPNKPNKPGNITSKIVGKNRYETAAKIADELVKNNVSYNSVILVNSDKSMADGLSAASLSGKKNAPILLVKKDSIPAEAMAKIEKAKNVYIIGGEGAISKNVENQLKGKNITRISGKDRYETSSKIASMLGGYKMAFIVNGAKGEADAMSVSSVAAKYGAPILLTNGKTSTHPVKEGVTYYVIGGRSVVSNQLADKYNADRIAGIDRYSTNRKVIDEFYYDSKKVYFAKGDTLVDALTASLLAKDNGMVLVSKNANHKKLEGKEAVQVGGMDFEISFE